MQFGDFYRSSTVSLTSSNSGFVSFFDSATATTISAALVSMGSASSDFQNLVDFCHFRMGEPILMAEITPVQIAACLNEAVFRFSYLCNSYFIQSQVAQVLGVSLNYTEQDFTTALPQANNTFLNAFMANQTNTGLYNQNTEKRRGFVQYNQGDQRHDIYSDGVDAETGLSIDAYVASITGYGVNFTEVYYTEGAYMNRLYDPNTNQQFIQAEFGFPSFPTDTVFYILPLWQDVLRGRLLSDSDSMRKSAYRHAIYGRILELTPRAYQSTQVWFNFYVTTNPNSGGSLSPLAQSSFSGLSYITDVAANQVASNFGTVPIKDLSYGTMNPVGRTWVREYTFALCMETLALTRGKLPWRLADGTQITLNADALFARSTELKNLLDTELKENLTKMDGYYVIQQETTKATNFQTYLKATSPMPVWRTKGY